MEGLTIFVNDRGRVLVGIPKQDPKDWFRLILTKCAIVRRWGTNSGLGQLAEEGPQPGTKLDKSPDGTSINKRYVMETIPCNERSWHEWLSS